MIARTPRLTSLDHELDLAPNAFGELRESNDFVDDPAALRARMDEDGYIFLRGWLDREEVLAAREEILRRLHAEGLLDPAAPLLAGITAPGTRLAWFPQLAERNPALDRALYSGPMIEYYTRLLGGPVRHFDFTWFRAFAGGMRGTPPHCDIVYMGRGTPNLYTSWTPIGDTDIEMGGLMVLEGSQRRTDLLKPYLERDVDTYCENRADAADIRAGRKAWQWDGKLAVNPVTLRARLGGRWLTTSYRAGDLLSFKIQTVHASLDNQTNRFRLSSDSRYQLATEAVDERWISIAGQPPIAHGLAGKRGRIC